MKRMVSLLGLVFIFVTVSACATAPVKYRTNSRVLLDVMQEGATQFVDPISVGSSDTIAIVNLEGGMDESDYPSTVVYDMLSTALTKKGATVVERDLEGLAASVLENSMDKLIFHLSPLCDGPCPKAVAAEKPVLPCCPSGTTPIPSCGGGCAGSAVAALPALPIGKKGKAAADGDAPAPLLALPGAKKAEKEVLPDWRNLLVSEIPRWFDRNGAKVVSQQDSATHVLGYRIHTYGVSIEPTEDKKVIRRRVRVDLQLRIIETKTGKLTWADRVSIGKSEKFPSDMRGLLSGPRYDYTTPQYSGSDKGKKGGLGALFSK